ncbi:MAG: aminotransferase [Firmicutes bacterium]|nr:aminotransferase [Bacillota bacterium]
MHDGDYTQLPHDRLADLRRALLYRYGAVAARNLRLDMSRGKPGRDQLDLSSGLLDCLTKDDYMSRNGIDCRNYGGLDGLAEMKEIFADILSVEPSEVIVGGNSSLNMMFDNIASNMSHGVRDQVPWQKQGKVRFICPVPGYDRHFAICDYFHIEMIPVPMTPEGPDMDEVERLVAGDGMIKGMWCVPVFSNPDGCVYSEETVLRLANMRPKAADFRLYWDNAYRIHHFEGELRPLPNIIRECEKAGNPHMPLEFFSFSKISFSGAAVSAVVSSASNCEFILKRLSVQTVGPDKLNMLRHARFFKNAAGVYRHMEKMAVLVRAKFDCLDGVLRENLGGKGIAAWNNPGGGYFVSFDTLPGCAKRVYDLCKNAGVALTAAGATYPYGRDPNDSNIRLAPTYPETDELRQAAEVFCLAVELASAEKLLGGFNG